MNLRITSNNVGTVYLVGAGPGDPELITLRGLRVLRRADVILHDRLIAPELLAEARHGAQIVNVGKYACCHEVPQGQINDLLVGYARSDKCVCRLKGGDPYVFGRGGEEALACIRAGIPCIVVPGVSSAHAVPAAAGVPLTHRGLARSYAVVTAQTDPACPGASLPYKALSAIDTIVIMMGRANLPEVTQGLIQAGRAGHTPAVCIEMGCTPQQRMVTSTLQALAEDADRAGLSAPVVTVVGDVADLSRDLPHSHPALAALGSESAAGAWDAAATRLFDNYL